MNKIKKLSELTKITKQLRRQGKNIGLITGCFDVIHFGHINLFRFAKRQVDILVVGIDNDKSIMLSKGKNRPLFPQRVRAEMLAELESVDYVFVIKEVFRFDFPRADSVQGKILKKIKPSYLITYPLADKYWQKKKERAEKLGVKFLGQKRKRRLGSSSKIIQKLETEL